MSWKIQYTAHSKQDLIDIYEYISFTLLEPETASRQTERILQAIRSLEDFPKRNPLYHEEPWHSQGLRFMPVNNYLVLYTTNTDSQSILIVRVIYGPRDVPTQLEKDK